MRAALAVALLAGGLTACDPPPTNKDVTARQTNFKAIGDAFKIVTDQVKTGQPDLDKVRPAATELVTRVGQIKDHFPVGSGPESGAKTKAKAAIWTNTGEFEKDRSAAVDAVADLDAAASAGDLAALSKTSAALGETCKTCHTQFREK